MPSLDALDFHWTVSSGSSRKALRALSEDDDTESLAETPFGPDEFQAPEYAMVSFATKMNEPWDGPTWIIDSGGYSTLTTNPEYQSEISDYVDFLNTHEATIDYYALRDWACEPDLLRQWDHSVEDHQQWTLRDHIQTIEQADSLDAEPIAVLQGYDVRDYLECIDLFRDHGLITDKMGIGSVCRRNQTELIRNTILRVREALPPRVDLHGFGVKQEVLESPDILSGLDSVDSNAWDSRLYYDADTSAHEGPKHYDDEWLDYRTPDRPSFNWRNMLIAYRDYRRDLGRLLDLDQIDKPTGDFETVTSLRDYRSGDHNADEYILVKCVCGTLLDPGQPADAQTGQCRHCEQTLLQLWDLHTARREQAVRGPYPLRCHDCDVQYDAGDFHFESQTDSLHCPSCGDKIIAVEEVHDPLQFKPWREENKDAQEVGGKPPSEPQPQSRQTNLIELSESG